jgi:hypothetical protein
MTKKLDQTEKVTRIRARAEEIALGLIRNGLASPDPQLNTICSRLSAFQPLLNGKDVDEKKARDLLRMGFGMVRFTPSNSATEDQEALRLLEALSRKVSSMGSLLLGFIGR